LFPKGEGIPPDVYKKYMELGEQEQRNRDGKASEALYGALTHGSTAARQRALLVGTSAQAALPSVQPPPLASSSTAPLNLGVVDPRPSSPIDAMQDILHTADEDIAGKLSILGMTGNILLNRLLGGLQNDTSNQLDAATEALSTAQERAERASEAEQLAAEQLRSAITQYNYTLDRYMQVVDRAAKGKGKAV
jgi:hypothetical protein